jgi:hypothetical protein
VTRPFVARIEGDDPDALAEDLRALELRGYHVSCPALDERMRLAKRDKHLRQAAELTAAGSTWGKSVDLAHEVNIFEAVLWPRWRDLESPPEGCSELRRHLFEACKLGELPTTPRRLYAILKQNGPGHFSRKRD